MRFRKKPEIIEAIQIKETMTIEIVDGEMTRRITGHAGDWIIIDEKGDSYFCVDSLFQEKYEPENDLGSEFINS